MGALLCPAKSPGQYQSSSSAQLAMQLGISDATLTKLERVFSAIDFDGSGEVDVGEFLAFFELKRTKFSKRVFSVMDADGSGEMDFTEFLLAVWNYCTFNKYALIRFAFELYDADGSGAIDTDEMSNMLKDVYGKKALKSNKQAQFVLEKITILGEQSIGDMEVAYPLFEDFCNKHPALLFPAFHLQLTLQTKIIGRRFWEGLEAKKAAIQKRVKKARGTGGNDNTAEEVNFREVMEFLSSLNEADRTKALNEAMEDAVEDIAGGSEDAQKIAKREVDRLSRMAGSGGADMRRKLRRRGTTGGSGSGPGSLSSHRSRKGVYKVPESDTKRGKRHGGSSSMVGRRPSLMEGGTSWRCGTCGRTNYPSDARCKTCRKTKGSVGGGSGSEGGVKPGLRRRTTGRNPVDWAAAGQ
jgi:serine/threonine-protein phosphatase 2B regulatory subunit